MPVSRKESEVFLSRIARQSFLSLMVAAALFGVGANSSLAQTDAEKPKAATVTPEMLSASFAEVSKRVEAAVVNIDTKGKAPADVTLKGEKPEAGSSDDLLELYRRMLPRRAAAAVGSGFIVDKTGYILTNAHVVEDAARIIISLKSGEEFAAKVVGTDLETDLAVLKIDAGRELPTVKLGNSDQARIGDWVLAIGSPFGLAQTVTAGIISQTKRETPQSRQFQKFIQTDAAINRGNSGGPLVNMDGEVIGVNSQIATSTGDYNGIGFAFPSNEAAEVYRQIKEIGKVRRGYFGVNLDSVKNEFAKVYGLPEAKGAIITNIGDKRGAAAVAGLLAGDIILEYNGEKVINAPDLVTRIAASTPEKEVSVVYLRENGDALERKTAVVKLAERPSSDPVSGETDMPKKLPVSDTKKNVEPFGLTLIELTPQLAAVYKVEGEKGLIIKNINPASFIVDVKNSNGSEAFNEGDLIQRINRQPVTDLKSFNETVNRLKKGDAVVLQVQSQDLRSQNPQKRIVQFTVQ